MNQSLPDKEKRSARPWIPLARLSIGAVGHLLLVLLALAWTSALLYLLAAPRTLALRRSAPATSPSPSALHSPFSAIPR